jgi:hypothetical protein
MLDKEGVPVLAGEVWLTGYISKIAPELNNY